MTNKIIYISAVLIFSFIFAKAGLYKVLLEESMVANMKMIGFGYVWTQFIGWAETLGAFGCLLGFYFSKAITHLSVLLLWPFAIGALTVHFSYQHPFEVFWQSLLVCLLPLVIFLTSKRFRLEL